MNDLIHFLYHDAPSRNIRFAPCSYVESISFLSIYLQEQKLTDKENETIANVYYGLGEAGAFQSAVKIYAALKAKGIKKIGLKKIGY